MPLLTSIMSYFSGNQENTFVNQKESSDHEIDFESTEHIRMNLFQDDSGKENVSCNTSNAISKMKNASVNESKMAEEKLIVSGTNENVYIENETKSKEICKANQSFDKTFVGQEHYTSDKQVKESNNSVVNSTNTTGQTSVCRLDYTTDNHGSTVSNTMSKAEELRREGSLKVTDCPITQDMIDEEKRFMIEDQKALDEIRESARKELERTGKKQRYDRLQLLLDRSKLYATYLLGRLESRKKEDEKQKQRQTKREHVKVEETKVEQQQEVPRRGGRVRKLKTRDNGSDNQSSQEKKETKQRGRKPKRKVDAMSKDSEPNFEENTKKPKLESVTSGTSPLEVQVSQKLGCNDRFLNGEKIPDRQPLLLTGAVMREYQLEGLDWLRGLFEHGINGILADEMGLGKTIQSISLICTLIEQRVLGPYLVAAPLSTLPNWISEFKKFAPEVHTILYHGNQKERAQLRRKLMRIKKYSNGFASLPVVISSYEILMRDRPLLDNYNIEWKYLIVDEGHRIKNLNCRLIKELKLYRAANRLLLTGTPLQNNLAELWSLLNFLLPDIFDDLNSFQRWFDFSALTDKSKSTSENNEMLIAQEQEGKVLQTLHSILTPFLLRRLKTDVDLSIPPKKEVLVYAPLTETQQMYYKGTLDKTILDLINKKNKVEETQELTPSGRPKRKSANVVTYDDDADDGDDFDLDQLVKAVEEQAKRKREKETDILEEKFNRKSIVNVKLQNIMMQLRKCCNHPYLLEYPFDSKTEELVIDERLVECSGKMLMLDKMLPELRRLGHKTLLFSQMTQMLDILGDYCNMRNFKFSRIDGTMSVQARQENIDSFANDDENFIFLLSTRAGGLGLNLMMADTCIIYDSDWNPQVDLQAQDRCHRIGQTKHVVIYRLVTANTVDEKIIERAANKRKLEKMIIHKKNFKGRGFASAITPQELVDLLDSTDASNTINSENIISETALKQLLDRSDMADWHKGKLAADKICEPSPNLQHNNMEQSTKLFKVLETTDNDGDVIF